MKTRELSGTSHTSLILFLFVVFAAAAAIEAQTVNLQFQLDVAVGNATGTPRFAVGDVNNDGLPDLVTLNKSNATAIGPISVFLNANNGGFNSPINIQAGPSGLSPNAVVIADFNKDGFQDLVIAQDGISNGVNIRLGNGTGNFATETFIAAERGSTAIVSADFNGDSNLDVAICNNVNELRVLNGNGLGGFAAAAPYTTSNVCQDLIAADFNVDGSPDLAITDRINNRVQVFLNNGAGLFNAPINNLIAGAYQMVTADFNRDCIPDLVVTQFSGSSVTMMLGDGAGGFATTGYTVTNSPAYMTVGDFNRDKKVDVAIRRNTLTAGANNFTILPGNGSGVLGAPFELNITTPANSVEMRLATIDANRDGKADIIIGREGGFSLYNGASALFTRTDNDFDGDLRTDLSTYRPSGGDWYVQRSTQGFSAQHWGIATDKPLPADYDGDGKADFAIWREGSQSAFWILQSSTNTFRFESFGQTGDSPVVTGDWDGDGKADPAVYRDAAAGGQSFFYFRGSLNNPSGGTTFIPWGTTGDQPARGDFDGDGKADAAIFRPSNGTWYLLQSSNLQAMFQHWGLAADKVVPGDYDGDGKTDLAVFRPSNTTWYVLNSAAGTMSFRQWGLASDSLTPGDYNGDGRTDIGVYRPSESRWYVPRCTDFMLFGSKFGTAGDVAVPSAFVP